MRYRLLRVRGLTHLGAIELAQGGPHDLANAAVAAGGDAPLQEYPQFRRHGNRDGFAHGHAGSVTRPHTVLNVTHA